MKREDVIEICSHAANTDMTKEELIEQILALIKIHPKVPRVICKNCGVEFRVSPTVVKKGRKYCSNQCWADAMRGKPVEDDVPKINQLVNENMMRKMDEEFNYAIQQHRGY